MRATLSNYKQSPQKVRLVADLIRGKTVREARETLTFLPKKAAPMFQKLLSAAVTNARGVSPDGLIITKLTVDKGSVLRRHRPFARGRAGSLRKTMSIVRLELGQAQSAKNKKQSDDMPPQKKRSKKIKA